MEEKKKMKKCKLCGCNGNKNCNRSKYFMLNDRKCGFTMNVKEFPDRNICYCCDNKIPSLQELADRDKPKLEFTKIYYKNPHLFKEDIINI